MLDTLKEYLRITWSEEDDKLQDILDRGENRLNELVGKKISYKKGIAQDLLLDYCRYIYNNASEYFEENFESEILRLQLLVATEPERELTNNED